MKDKKTKKGSSATIADVISAGLMGIHEASDVLSRIWRIVLYETNLTASQWHSQLNKWQSKIAQKHTDKKLSSMKGNTTRTLSKPKISWGALIRGFTILEYERMDIQLTLWKKGKSRVINVSVDIADDGTVDLEEDREE